MNVLNAGSRRLRRTVLAVGGGAVCAVLLTGCTMTDIQGAINQVMMFFQVISGGGM